MNQTVMYAWLYAGDAGNFDIFDELLHPNVIIHAPLGLSTKSSEAEKQVWRKALEAMPDIQHNVREAVVNDNIEMARIIVTGTLESDFAGAKGSGKSFKFDQAIIMYLQGGKATEGWEITDTSALTAQTK
jgi:predicted ester cyclase